MKYFKSYFIFCLFIFPGFLSGQSLDASFSSSDVDQCPGSLFTVRANNLSYSSYNWLVRGPNNYSFNSTNNSSSISLILSTSGNYSVTLTVGNGVTTAKSDQPNYLTVYSRPVVSYVLTPTSGCVPLQVDFNGSCSAGAGTISSFFITTGTGGSSDKEDFKFTYSEVGSYTPSATVTNSFGCFTTQNLSTITVNPLPSLSSSTSPPAICSGETFSYTPTSATAGCTFSWSRAAVTGISQTASSGTGNISEVLTNTSSSNITVIYSVVTTDPNGCKRTQNVSIVVKAKPVISIDSPSLLVCPGQTGTLTASAVPSGGLFTWANGLGTNQSITVSAAGTYTVGYSLSNCAADSKSAVVTIGTTPTVSTSLKESSGVTNDDGTICPGGTVTMTATPSALGGTYLWQPGGETTQTINVSPSTTTTYSVVYTLNCPSASSSRMVTVSPGTVNNYTSSVTNACGFPVTTIFNSTATALGGATIASTQWSFPGGTPSSASGSGPISVTYNSSGAYAVTMTTTSNNNCVRTNTFNPAIVVGTGVNVTSKFEASVTTVCADEPFTFKYTGSGADSIKWELGDGKVIWSSDDKSITYTYDSPGNYTVSMTPHSVVGGYLACIGSISKFDVTVLGPKADFSVSNVVCSNQFTRTFKQLSRGTTPSTTYEWEFPGGTPATSTAATQTVTWANEGSYSVKLKATDLTTGCLEKEKTMTINVNKNTGADFQVTLSGVPTTNICLGTTLTFTNTTPTPQNNSGTAPGSLTSTKTQWDWNTNDGVSFVNASVGTPQTRSFTTANGYAPGSYGISMRNIDNNNCENIITKSNFIRINGVVATISAPASLCIGQTFSPTHSGSLAAIASTRWDFGDGNSSTSNTPTHSYSVPGDYKVTLTLVDTSSIKCTTTVVHNVIVRNPKASFTINNNYICSSQKLAVTNTSTGVGLTYNWTASNGSPSSSKNPSPGTFSFPQGNQTVKLAVTDDIGCKDSITIPISVFDLIVSATPSGTSFPCFNPPNVVSFKNTSSNNVNKNSARWDFGNGKKSTSWEPSAIYSERGTYLVKLTVSSNSGCSSTIDVATINVGGASGSIDATNSVLTGCSCYEVSFDVSSSNADESVLLFGDGAFKTLDPNTTQKVSYSYCNSSSDPVTYIPSIFVKNNTCNGIIEAIDTIKINPNPVITGESALCVGATIKLTATGTPASTNTWVSSNTAVAAVSSTGTVTGVASGTTTITFTDINGCSTSKTITVNANPTISGETSVCKDLTLQLTGSGIAATTNPWKSSSLSVATINNSGLVTGVSAGTSTITYTNNNGCFVNQSITVNATPTISNANAICEKETLQLTGSATASTTTPWTSSNTTVATISNSGLVTGVSAGTTTITYTNSNGCSTTASITVNSLPTITGNVVLCPNTTSQLTGSPTAATTNPWVSANTTIATISNTGLVTARAFGTSVITYRNSLGCSNTSTISVSDPINPIFNQVPAICSGGTLSALPTSSTNSVNGTWAPSLNNTATTTYTFTPTAGQCANTANMTITVNPPPTITGATSVCEKATLQLTGSVTAATTNPWTSSNTAVATISNSGLLTSLSAGTTTITYLNSNGCSTTSLITVNALPTITGNTVLCLNTTSQLTGSPTAATTNPWVSANTTIATISNTGLVTARAFGTSVITYKNSLGCSNTATINVSSPVTPTFNQVPAICSGGTLTALPTTSNNSVNGTWLPALNNTATTTYTFTPSAGQCANTTTMTITVNSLPTITGGTSVCEKVTLQLTGNGTAATTNPWISSNTNVATISNSGLLTSLSAGTTTITYTNNNGCSNTTTITVNSPVTPTFTQVSAICSGASLSALPTTSSNSVPGTWTPAINNTATTTYTFTPNSGECANATTMTITVNSNPTILGGTSVCFGNKLEFVGSGIPATSNPWISSNTSSATVSNTGLLTGISAGTSTVTYSDVNGCKATRSVTVNSNPTISGDKPICKDATLQLTGNGTAATINPWSSSNTSVATISNSGLVTALSDGTTTITYSNSNACSVTKSITVNALPTINGGESVCKDATLQLTGNGTAATTNPWVSSNTAVATISNTGLVTGVSAGTTTITYTNNNGCSTTASITVNALPTITGNIVLCLNTTSQLTGSPTAATSNPWISANTSIATITSEGLVTAKAKGTSLITYRNSLNCSNTATVTVTDPINPSFASVPAICNGSALSTLPTKSTNDVNGTWSPALNNVATTTYTFTPTAGQCANSAILTITVNPLPTISGEAPVCAKATLQLTGSATAATTNPWTSSSTAVATVSNSGLVTGVSAGTTTITYTNNNGCSTTASITVNALPTITGNTVLCPNTTSQLIGSPTQAISNPWVSANTSIATITSEGLVTAKAFGTSVITYRNDQGCSNTSTINVTNPVNPTFTQVSAICSGGTLSALPTTSNNSVNGTWLPALNNTATTTYTFTPATGQCSNSANMTITVNPLPTITGGTEVCEKSTLQLTGNGTAATTNPWTSSNTAVATVSNTGLLTSLSAGTTIITYTNNNGCSNTTTITVNSPVTPTFTQVSAICSGASLSALPTTSSNSVPGTWSPSLNNTATTTYTFTPNSGQCANTATMTITVNALPTISGGSSVCLNSKLQLTGSGTAATTSPWTSSNTAVATVSNTGLVVGLSDGTTTITYTNNIGCSRTSTITVNPLPAISGTSTVCRNKTLQLIGTPTPATTNTWVSANTSVATINNSGLVNGISSGKSLITYTNSLGCTDTMTVNVTQPINSTFTQVSAICSGGTLTALPTTSNNIINGTWSPVLNNTATTTYTFTPNSDQCANTATMSITVNPLPTISGGTEVCEKATLQLTGNGTAATTTPWTSSNTSVATISNTGLVAGLSEGTTTITYTNNNGCSNTSFITVNALPTITGNVVLCLNTDSQLSGSGTPASSNPWVSANTTIATITSGGLVSAKAFGKSLITYKNNLGCVDTITVTVTDPITPTFTQVPAICFGGALSELPTTSTNNVSGTWLPALNNTATTTYTFTPTAGQCAKTATMTITVNQLPTIGAGTSVCEKATLQLTGSPTAATSNAWNSSNTAAATIISNTGLVTGVSTGITTITYTNNNGCATTREITVNSPVTPTFTQVSAICSGANLAALPTSSTNGISGTWSPARNNTTTTTYTFTPSAGQCATTALMTITVNSLPTISGGTTVCKDATLQLTGNGTAATLSPWTSSSTSVATVSELGLVVGLSAGIATITYTDNNGCSIGRTTTVNALPTISGNKDLCLNTNLQLTGSGTAATSDAWVSASSSIATINNTGLVSGKDIGTSLVTYKNSLGCSNSVTVKVTNPVTPTFIQVSDICSGDKLNALPTSSTNSINGTWAPSLNNTATTTYTFTPTAGQCANTTTMTITVNPLPTISGGTSVCKDATIQLTGSGTAATPTPWTSSNTTIATISNSGLLTGVSAGTTTITYTNNIGCSRTSTITVNALPTINGNTVLCLNATSQLTGSPTAATTNPWVSASTSIATITSSGLVTARALGTSVITYNNSLGCSNTATINVTNPITPTFTQVSAICSGGTLSALPLTSNNSVNGTWSPALNNTATTKYTFTPNSGQCANTATIDIVVNPLPTITGNTSVCKDETLQLSGNEFPAITNPWTSSNTSVASVSNTGLVTGVTAGTATITYTNNIGCSRDLTITVNALPTISGTTLVCVNATSQLAGTVSPATLDPWVSSNTTVATISNAGLVSALAKGTSTITYKNSLGCSNTAIITVTDPITPTFNPVSAICSGANLTPLPTSSTNTTPINGTWLPAINNTATTTYTFTPGSGLCATQASLTITINPLPEITGEASVCKDASLQLIGNGTASASNPWKSSSALIATVSNNGLVTGVSAGSVTITYTNNNGCSIGRTITVNGLPKISGNTLICVNATSQLTGTATAAPTNPWISTNTSVATVSSSGLVNGIAFGKSLITYRNSLGCSDTMTVNVTQPVNSTFTQVPAICSGGSLLALPITSNNSIKGTWLPAINNKATTTYTFTPTSGQCANTATMEIVVNPLPTITGGSSVCKDATIQLTGNGTAATTNPWVSSNTSFATISSTGLVTGVSTGSTKITYTNNIGCSRDTNIIVNALPTISGNKDLCLNTNLQLTGSGTAASSSAWVSASPSIATISDMGLVNPIAIGTSVVTYQNSLGCSNTATINVIDPIIPTFTQVSAICSGANLMALPTSSTNSTPITGTWSPALNNKDTTTYTFTPNPEFCATKTTMTIAVNPLPTITGGTSVCEKDNLQLTGNGAAATTNPWTSSNAAVAIVSNSGQITGVSAGFVIITYTNNNGCSIGRTITVNALPTITGNTVLCLNATSQLTGSPTAATTNPWVSSNTTVATITILGRVTARELGTSEITYRNNQGCSNTAIITVTDSIVPTFTQVSAICSGDDLSELPKTSTNSVGISGTWSPALNNKDTTTYTFTPNPELCATKTTMTIAVNPLPTITGGSSVCKDATLQLTGNGTAATTNPWVSGNTSFATISTTGLVTAVSAGTTKITYTNNNGCSRDTNIVVNALPTISGNKDLCLNTTLQLTGSGTAASSNAWVSASPSIATISDMGLVNPIAIGTSVVTYQNSLGCSNTATINVIAPITPTFTQVSAICSGANLTALPDSSTNTTPIKGTWSPALNNTTTATYTFTPNSDECANTANMTITVNPLPTITGGSSVCKDATLQLNGNGTAATTNPWVSSKTAVATISNTGLVTGVSADTTKITYTNSIGCSRDTNIVVNALPTANAGIDTVLCSGDSIRLNGSFGGAATLIEWSGGLGRFNPNNKTKDAHYIPSPSEIAAGNVTLTLTTNDPDGPCNAASDNLTITIQKGAVVDAGVDKSVCADKIVQLNGSYGGNATGILWSGGTGNFSNKVSPIATYGPSPLEIAAGKVTLYLTTDDPPGICGNVKDSVVIKINSLPDVEAGLDTFLCLGQCLLLNAKSTSINVPVTFAWNNGGTQGSSFCPSNSSVKMVVTATDAFNCKNKDSLLISFSNAKPPVVSAGPDTTICFGEQLTLFGRGEPNVTYTWNNGVIDSKPFKPTKTDTYIVTGKSNLTRCFSIDSMLLTINPSPDLKITTPDSVLCIADTAFLLATGALKYQWLNGGPPSADYSFIPDKTAKYFVVGFNQFGCADTASITVSVNPYPIPRFESDMKFGGCLPFSPTFKDITGRNGLGPESDSVIWDFGNGLVSFQEGSTTANYDAYGCYNVTLTSISAPGCESSLTIENVVCVNEITASFNPDPSVQLVSNPYFKFVNKSKNATAFEWDFGDTTDLSLLTHPEHGYQYIGEYVVRLVASAQDGCTDTAYRKVKVKDDLVFNIPNTFTPDGDNLNEIFSPMLLAGFNKYVGYSFGIYNRWGKEVFFTTTPGQGWDGFSDGKIVPAGIYLWKIRLKSSVNNESFIYTGHVNVLR
jgi:gliding motility-associated-like protein